MQALQKISTSEAVVTYFKDRISDGELPPGEKLPSERVLRDRFQISRFSLREGLAKLSALGLVRIVHGKGTFVAESVDHSSLSDVLLSLRASAGKQQTAELLEARTFLEGELSALAAERRSPELLTALAGNLEKSLTNLGDKEAFCRDDLEFHQIIARMAQNNFLFNMHAALWTHVYPVMLKNAKTRKARAEIVGRHTKLLAAIKSGDPAKVRALSAKFLSLGKENYC